jgi:ribosomal protein S27E
MKGRKTTIPPGTSLNGFTVTDLPAKYKGKNRLITVKCNACGTQRECWNTALRANAVKCPLCGTKDTKLAQELFVHLPRLAVYEDRILVLKSTDDVPPDCRLFKFYLADLALPFTPAPAQEDKVPEPDSGWHYALKVPAQWLDFYCDIGDLSDDQTTKAVAYFDEHVFSPTETAYSPCSKGSGTKWREGGQLYAYLYWRDHNTWLRNGPAPASYAPPASKPFVAKPLNPEDFPDLHNEGWTPPIDPTEPTLP